MLIFMNQVHFATYRILALIVIAAYTLTIAQIPTWHTVIWGIILSGGAGRLEG